MRAAAASKPRASRKSKTPLEAVSTAPGTITIPAHCKPSKAVSPERTRPVICHAYLRRRDGDLWLCATDSYIAVAVKVTGDAQEGFVPVGALRLMERGQKAEQVSKTAWKVWTNEGTVVFDIADKVDGAVAYPDFDKLNVFDGPEADKAPLSPNGKFAIGIDHELIKRVGDSIGGKRGLRFEFTGPLRAVRLVPLQAGTDRVGLCMPIRLEI